MLGLFCTYIIYASSTRHPDSVNPYQNMNTNSHRANTSHEGKENRRKQDQSEHIVNQQKRNFREPESWTPPPQRSLAACGRMKQGAVIGMKVNSMENCRPALA